MGAEGGCVPLKKKKVETKASQREAEGGERVGGIMKLAGAPLQVDEALQF